MNKVFADHVTSTAFFLSISKKQIKYMQHLFNYPYGTGNHYNYELSGIDGSGACPNNFIASFNSLERKGLIERVVIDDKTNLGYKKLTRAGELTCELLIEAGLMLRVVEQEKAA